MRLLVTVGIGILSKYIPQWFIHYVSIGLFLLFGFKMMIEGIKMTEEQGQQEYMEAQKCIKENDKVGLAV